MLLMSSRATAQGMPVYDNTNFISLVKQLLESGKQTAEMIKSVKFLKDAKEAIEKVAAAQGFDYVLDASEGGGVLVSKGKNLLPDVKKELGF